MPLYEKHCKSCNYSYDVLCSVADKDANNECPKCGCAVDNVIGAPALNFKGDGFYINDSKKSSKEAAKKLYEGDKYTPSE